MVMAAALWGRCWAGQLVVFHSDNMGVMASVNKGISPEASLMQLLRLLSFIAAYFQFNYKAVHVAGVLNGPADATYFSPLFHRQVPTRWCPTVSYAYSSPAGRIGDLRYGSESSGPVSCWDLTNYSNSI